MGSGGQIMKWWKRMLGKQPYTPSVPVPVKGFGIEELIITTVRNIKWKWYNEGLNIDNTEYTTQRILELYALNYEGEFKDSKAFIDAIKKIFEVYLTQLREQTRLSKKEYGM